jgi:hypothetical protein
LLAARHGHVSLCELVGRYFTQQAPAHAETISAGLTEATDADGHSPLHALVLAGSQTGVRQLLLALPVADALALLRRRARSGALASELSGDGLVAPHLAPAVALAAAEVASVASQLAAAGTHQPEEAVAPPPAAVGAAAVPSGSGGRGGAVRRRKSSGSSDASSAVAAAAAAGVVGGAGGGSASVSGGRGMEIDPESDQSDDTKAAAAAGDLLQLASGGGSAAHHSAAIGSVSGSGRARAHGGGRARDAKPYQRRASGRSGGRTGGRSEKDCWLPGGFWWQDDRTPMPPGRQPGELAGWTPLAGTDTQQRLQEQRAVLSATEHFVQGLGSRDDAAAYLQRLEMHPPPPVPGISAPEPGSPAGNPRLRASVDDLAIEGMSKFKKLASWGGFRRHHVASEVSKEEDAGAAAVLSGQPPPQASQQQQPQQPQQQHHHPAVAAMSGGAPVDHGDGRLREQIQQRLLAKRAEVLATQARLESLSLEQRELECLYTRSISKS